MLRAIRVDGNGVRSVLRPSTFIKCVVLTSARNNNGRVAVSVSFHARLISLHPSVARLLAPVPSAFTCRRPLPRRSRSSPALLPPPSPKVGLTQPVGCLKVLSYRDERECKTICDGIPGEETGRIKNGKPLLTDRVFNRVFFSILFLQRCCCTAPSTRRACFTEVT